MNLTSLLQQYKFTALSNIHNGFLLRIVACFFSIFRSSAAECKFAGSTFKFDRRALRSAMRSLSMLPVSFTVFNASATILSASKACAAN
jgi:hypothetical protein